MLTPTMFASEADGQDCLSPAGWPLTSPGLGRTPGHHVVQEGRLSLELRLSLTEGDIRAGLGNNTRLEVISQGNAKPYCIGGSVDMPSKDYMFSLKCDEASLASQGMQTANVAALNVATGAAYSHKLTPPSLMNDLIGPTEFKKFNSNRTNPENRSVDVFDNDYACTNIKPPNALDASFHTPKLKDSVENIVDLNGINGIDVEAGNNFSSGSPLLLSNMPSSRPRRSTRRSKKRVREHSPELFIQDGLKRNKTPRREDFNPIVMAPQERRQKISALTDHLHRTRQETNRLDREIQELEAKLSSVSSDNEQLWKLLSYFNACIHEALSGENEPCQSQDEVGHENADVDIEIQNERHRDAGSVLMHVDASSNEFKAHDEGFQNITSPVRLEPLMDSGRIFTAMTPGDAFVSALSPHDSELRPTCPLFMSPVEGKFGFVDSTLRSSPFHGGGREHKFELKGTLCISP